MASGSSGRCLASFTLIFFLPHFICLKAARQFGHEFSRLAHSSIHSLQKTCLHPDNFALVSTLPIQIEQSVFSLLRFGICSFNLHFSLNINQIKYSIYFLLGFGAGVWVGVLVLPVHIISACRASWIGPVTSFVAPTLFMLPTRLYLKYLGLCPCWPIWRETLYLKKKIFFIFY